MTIEISRAKSTFQYHISPKDPCVVERRTNRPNARYYFYLRRDTPREAKAALLQLEREEEET